VLHKGMVKRGHRRHGRDIGLIIHLSGVLSQPDPMTRSRSARLRKRLTPMQLIHINLGCRTSPRCQIGRTSWDTTAKVLLMISRGWESMPSQPARPLVRVAKLGADMIKTT
jgi:fructose-bisphosphate aldolase/2-amino-3,7-dideoxy-D-threo-hept-6-ulosonate synthase